MKYKKTISLYTALFIALILLLGTAAIYNLDCSKSAVLDGRTYFTSEVFGRTVLAIKSRNIFDTRLLDISRNEFSELETAYWGNNGHIIALGSKELSIYTKAGTKSYIESGDSKYIDICVRDIDGDNFSELIVLKADYANEFADRMIIYRIDAANKKGINAKEIYTFECSELKPWKVQTADVDGDGTVEISLGVYKTTPFDEEIAKRPFIYNWTSDYGLFPKWRGSSLSRPFEDYVFGDIELKGADELISIELSRNGGKVLTSYVWRGFGFEKTAESDVFEEITGLKCKEREIIAKVKSENHIYWGKFGLENGTIILKEKSNNYIW